MARIVPKLNLNKTPELVDNNSLIFAKNIRFNSNGISSDFGFDKISVEHLTHGDLDWLEPNEQIVGVIPYNMGFYLFINNPVIGSYICEYNELTRGFSQCNCNWNWSGGEIDGVCTINLNGDTLLTICEKTGDKKVPLKTINLNESSITDNESLYTQAPQIPLFNLVCKGYYNNVIPAGVYQFFIRYEIRKDFYTNWIPVSKELFAGTHKSLITNQGEVQFIDKAENVALDSNTSFVLGVQRVFNYANSSVGNLTNLYKRFQLGFIISNDAEVYARAYKHYNIDTVSINFDYDTEFIQEIDVRDLLENIYDVYDVGNVTAFKNKLYISNYTESDFNDADNKDLIDTFVNNIQVNIATKEISNYFNYLSIDGQFSDDNYLTHLKVDGQYKDIAAILRTALHQSTFSTFIQNYTAASGTTQTLESNGIRIILNKISQDIGIVRPDLDETPLQYKETHSYFEPTTSIDTLIDRIANTIWGISTSTGAFVKEDRLPTQGITYNIQYFVPKSSMSAEEQATFQSNWAQFNLEIRFDVDLADLAENKTVYDNVNTLIPYQTYKFYVHLVRDNGEITNGYEICAKTIQEYPRVNGYPVIIYPDFTFSSDIPQGYVACFISIAHVGENVSQIFNIHNIGTTASSMSGGQLVPDYSYLSGDCLELDTNLRPELQDISAIINGVRTSVDYMASYDPSNLLTFGASGKCIIDNSTPITLNQNGDTYGFIVSPYVASDDYIQLIRCTGYLRFQTFGNSYVTSSDENYYDDLNLLGYICGVRKLRDNTASYYAGSDIYIKETNCEQNKITATLKTLDHDDIDIDTKIIDANEEEDVNYGHYHRSKQFVIYSNYNLNYLSLHDTINTQIVTKTKETVVKNITLVEGTVSDTVEEEETIRTSKTFVTLSVPSNTMSEIYELMSMYRTYSRKTYLPFTDYNVLVRFDNTIRSSKLEGDESKINMFKFAPTDYYNVPTDKGIIINLVAVGDNILVHTQDSIYKFSGQNSLTAAGGEDVQMKESEPFDTGIQELFGSEFGYAGLASKEHQILSEFGYTFWDRDSGRIYLYTGNAQMKVLSDDISKLLRRSSITNLHLADDYYNNRIFICIEFDDNKVATLSYDFVAKSFISVHDFSFTWHFKTKTKCYFIYGNYDVYRVGTVPGSYEPFLISQNNTVSDVYPKHGTEDCIVDVIYNDRFEVIKTLNVLQWVCNKIEGFDTQINMAEETFSVASYEERYKGDALRIYSDSCMTDKLDISFRSNDERLRLSDEPFSFRPKPNSYTQVRYNLGKWTFNYFRNILNRKVNPVTPRTLAQDDTLIYGKYFVARFIFSRNINFKFEDVSFFTSSENNA